MCLSSLSYLPELHCFFQRVSEVSVIARTRSPAEWSTPLTPPTDSFIETNSHPASVGTTNLVTMTNTAIQHPWWTWLTDRVLSGSSSIKRTASQTTTTAYTTPHTAANTTTTAEPLTTSTPMPQEQTTEQGTRTVIPSQRSTTTVAPISTAQKTATVSNTTATRTSHTTTSTQPPGRVNALGCRHNIKSARKPSTGILL